jgi:hypothetical protein
VPLSHGCWLRAYGGTLKVPFSKQAAALMFHTFP